MMKPLVNTASQLMQGAINRLATLSSSKHEDKQAQGGELIRTCFNNSKVGEVGGKSTQDIDRSENLS